MKPQISQKGIALDIDETLSWTVYFWVEQLQKLFGNPENLSIEELINKYQYTQNVPYWQTPEALEWMETHRSSNEIQLNLPLIENADKIVNKISEVIPVSAYITTRPESVIEGTQSWLKQKGFPQAPIICRPNEISSSDGNKWKASVLEDLYPKVFAIVDDNPGLIKHLSPGYEGQIFLYGADFVEETTLNVIPCVDWDTVYERVKLICAN